MKFSPTSMVFSLKGFYVNLVFFFISYFFIVPLIITKFMRDEINPSSMMVVIYNGFYVLSIVGTRMIIRSLEIHMNEFKG